MNTQRRSAFTRKLGVLSLLLVLVLGATAQTQQSDAQTPTYHAAFVMNTACDRLAFDGGVGSIDTPAFEDPVNNMTTWVAGSTSDFESFAKGLTEPSSAIIVYHGDGRVEDVTACGDVVPNRINGDYLVVSLREMNASGTTGALWAAKADSGQVLVYLVALRDAFAGDSGKALSDYNGLHPLGARGTCEDHGKQWWAWDGEMGTHGEMAYMLSENPGTQFHNYTGGPHHFTIRANVNNDAGLELACGDAVGTVFQNPSTGVEYLTFRLDATDDFRWVGAIIVNDAGDNVQQLAIIFPGVHR